MSDSCNELNIKPIKLNELGIYTSVQSNDTLLIVEKNKSKFFSKKSTFSDFVSSIVSLTSSLSGNIYGKFIGELKGNLSGSLTGSILSGSLKGTFIGPASVIGTPFTTLNGYPISFKGTSSFSVNSNNCLTSSQSETAFSSSYSLSSSYVSCSLVDSTTSSSYTQVSNLANLSVTSSKSNFSNLSLTSSTTEYAINGFIRNKSEHSLKSDFSTTSSYAYKGLNFNKSIYSKSSNTSSYSLYSRDSNLTKAYLQFWGYDSVQFRSVTSSLISLNQISAFNIKSIGYIGRRRIFTGTNTTTDEKPDDPATWWPTFYVEFLNPMKSANYIVQGTIWEVDLFAGEEFVGSDCEIGTFQIPEYGVTKHKNSFTMSWQGGLKNNSQIWMGSFHVVGTDDGINMYNNVSTDNGVIFFT